jgi:hypothetical protein
MHIVHKVMLHAILTTAAAMCANKLYKESQLLVLSDLCNRPMSTDAQHACDNGLIQLKQEYKP